MLKQELLKRKEELESELDEINTKLSNIELSEKPYEAVVFGYSSPGRSSVFYKNEDSARKKYNEYKHKSYFRNGLVYGAAIYKYKEDGTRDRIDYVEKVHYWKCPE